jgi:hypothetical protein
MRRQLSQLLILLLMLLSPLTFSTDKVPNFTPDGEACASFRAKAAQTAAVVRSAPTQRPPRARQAVTRYAAPAPRTPRITSFAIPLRGRAPPCSLPIPG